MHTTGMLQLKIIIFALVAPEAVDCWVANFQQFKSPNEQLLSTAFPARVCRKYRGPLEVLIVISVVSCSLLSVMIVISVDC